MKARWIQLFHGSKSVLAAKLLLLIFSALEISALWRAYQAEGPTAALTVASKLYLAARDHLFDLLQSGLGLTLSDEYKGVAVLYFYFSLAWLLLGVARHQREKAEYKSDPSTYMEKLKNFGEAAGHRGLRLRWFLWVVNLGMKYSPVYLLRAFVSALVWPYHLIKNIILILLPYKRDARANSMELVGGWLLFCLLLAICVIAIHHLDAAKLLNR